MIFDLDLLTWQKQTFRLDQGLLLKLKQLPVLISGGAQLMRIIGVKRNFSNDRFLKIELTQNLRLDLIGPIIDNSFRVRPLKKHSYISRVIRERYMRDLFLRRWHSVANVDVIFLRFKCLHVIERNVGSKIISVSLTDGEEPPILGKSHCCNAFQLLVLLDELHLFCKNLSNPNMLSNRINNARMGSILRKSDTIRDGIIALSEISTERVPET